MPSTVIPPSAVAGIPSADMSAHPASWADMSMGTPTVEGETSNSSNFSNPQNIPPSQSHTPGISSTIGKNCSNAFTSAATIGHGYSGLNSKGLGRAGKDCGKGFVGMYGNDYDYKKAKVGFGGKWDIYNSDRYVDPSYQSWVGPRYLVHFLFVLPHLIRY